MSLKDIDSINGISENNRSDHILTIIIRATIWTARDNWRTRYKAAASNDVPNYRKRTGVGLIQMDIRDIDAWQRIRVEQYKKHCRVSMDGKSWIRLFPVLTWMGCRLWTAGYEAQPAIPTLIDYSRGYGHPKPDSAIASYFPKVLNCWRRYSPT